LPRDHLTKLLGHCQQRLVRRPSRRLYACAQVAGVCSSLSPAIQQRARPQVGWVHCLPSDTRCAHLQTLRSSSLLSLHHYNLLTNKCPKSKVEVGKFTDCHQPLIIQLLTLTYTFERRGGLAETPAGCWLWTNPTRCNVNVCYSI